MVLQSWSLQCNKKEILQKQKKEWVNLYGANPQEVYGQLTL